jgi:hypothetical protein
MTIPATYQALSSRLFKKIFFEREVFFETRSTCGTKEFQQARMPYQLTIQWIFLQKNITKHHWREFLAWAKHELVKSGEFLSSVEPNFKIDFS